MKSGEDIIRLMQEAARKAGGFILSEFDRFAVDKMETKSTNNFVSYVDKQAEKMIVHELDDAFQGQVFLGEEFSPDAALGEYTWIIDPLDGTTNFVHHFPLFTVSIGLAHFNDIIAGVIYDPVRDEMFSAYKGRGAFLNGEKIRVTTTGKMADSLWAIGFPYHHGGKMADYLKFVEFTISNTHGVRRLGSAAADLAWVAAGRADGFFEYGLSPWDVAAGAIIVKEAGGEVSDFSNGNNFLMGKEIVADNGKIHEEFLGHFRKYY